jgi:hypothetical protein
VTDGGVGGVRLFSAPECQPCVAEREGIDVVQLAVIVSRNAAIARCANATVW